MWQLTVNVKKFIQAKNPEKTHLFHKIYKDQHMLCAVNKVKSIVNNNNINSYISASTQIRTNMIVNDLKVMVNQARKWNVFFHLSKIYQYICFVDIYFKLAEVLICFYIFCKHEFDQIIQRQIYHQIPIKRPFPNIREMDCDHMYQSRNHSLK